jgi:hypothetical protein
LQKQIAKKNNPKAKRKIKDQPWVYFTIILLLLLTIICYVIIKKRMDDKVPAVKTVSALIINQTAAINL